MPQGALQLDFFDGPTDEGRAHSARLMAAYDNINKKFGRGTIRLAAEGHVSPGKAHAAFKSPAYATRWEDVARAKIY